MKGRQRYDRLWPGLLIIFACLLATDMLVVTAPGASYASGSHAATNTTLLLYQGQQGPELCALLK